MALLLVLQCKVSQLLKVCNRHTSSEVAGAHELVHMTVAHFKQLENLIVPSHYVKKNSDNRVNAIIWGNYARLYAPQNCTTLLLLMNWYQ